MQALKADPQMASMVEGGFPAPDIVDLATHVAQGRKAHADGDYDSAVAHYEAAQKIEKTIPYTEPPYWYYPVAQSLGAAHYKAGRYEEAQKAFREALFKAPNSGWALYGLSMTEKKLGNDLEAKAAKEAMAKSWIGDNAWLTMDRL